ncbi:bifunctional diaminohydroxyphosphoribosylaminopyrimidine deaminase/5-amino-6-(5-phosphoribosylamino)uracil reductase RibD [candidate division KSB1 bacterium]|nr:bifunctional diaminohydroxyphosphoribosylaminopyrimidine deaminase/5-amino-6-(5-phosphoribosylamino)uracil reductase RibD [candidate division KSB1 bacterium]
MTSESGGGSGSTEFRGRESGEADERFMRIALREAARGAGLVSPNPLVGAVAVKDGKLLARAYHVGYGDAHAEVELLGKLSANLARDATVYVNLEPCCHVGKTAPCTEALIRAGVRRVVIGHEDPNPLVSGNGIAALRAAGIQVAVGVMEREARRINAPFLTYITRGRPWLLMKVGQSLDGRIALANGQSRWITGVAARTEVHKLRATLDAVIVGSQTVLDDDPELTVRHVAGRDPLRIVLDSRLRISPGSRVFKQSQPARTWVMTTESSLGERGGSFADTGATLFGCAANPDGRLDLTGAMRTLAQHGITSALVEGGGTLHASLIREGLFDKFIVAIAPLLLGGDGRPAVGDLGLTKLDNAPRFVVGRCRRLGHDIWLEFERDVYGNR